MSIEVSCDCAMTYRLPDRFAGKRARCRECGDSIRVPAIMADESNESSGELAEDEASDESDAAPVRRKARPAPKAAKPKLPAKPVARSLSGKPLAPKRLPKARPERAPSESLHQMAPLNLSESRVLEPPAARKRVKAHKADIAAAAKSRTEKSRARDLENKRLSRKARERALEAQEDEVEEVEDQDLEDQDANEDERPSKKKAKKGKKAKKAKPAARNADLKKADLKKSGIRKLGRRGAASDSQDSDEDESGEDDAPAKKKLSPRQAKRRQQLILLAGSLGALVLCAALFFGLSIYRSNAEAATAKRFDDAKAMKASAEALALAQDWEKAEKAYKDTIAFVEDEKLGPIQDAQFLREVGLLKARMPLLPKVIAMRAKLRDNPPSAVSDCRELLGYQDDLIQTAALEGLVATGEGNGNDYEPYANAGSKTMKAAARKGLLAVGTPAQLKQLVPLVIKDEGDTTELGKQAIEKALDNASTDTPALVAVLERARSSDARVRALKLLAGSHMDPAALPAVEKLLADPDAEVARAAKEAKSAIKGETP
jgi:hypothetical protein